MAFTVNESYHATVIAITGKFFGSLEGKAFSDQIATLKAAGQKHVVIDLAKTDMMDSTAIGVLLAGLTTMRREGGDIRLANMKKRIKNLFLMTRLLGNVFETYDSLDEALASFKEQPLANTKA